MILGLADRLARSTTASGNGSDPTGPSSPTGFYRNALRTYSRMLSRLAWQDLPDSLTLVATDVEGRGTEQRVFLFLADLLTLREGGSLILQLARRHVLATI